MYCNRTLSDGELALRASRGIQKKAKIALAAFVVVLFGVFMLIAVFDALKSNDLSDWIIVGVWGVFLVALLLFIAFGFDKLVKKNAAKMSGDRRVDAQYRFGDERIEIHAVTLGQDLVTDTRVGYSAIVSVTEFPDMWAMYVDKVNSYVIRKDGMTEGTAEELSAFLREKTGLRYKLSK